MFEFFVFRFYGIDVVKIEHRVGESFWWHEARLLDGLQINSRQWATIEKQVTKRLHGEFAFNTDWHDIAHCIVAIRKIADAELVYTEPLLPEMALS